MTPRKRVSRHRSGNPFAYFLMFFLLALGMVMLLEYQDYRRGRPTFLLSRILKAPAAKKTPPPDSRHAGFHRELVLVLDNRTADYSLIRDSRGRFHVKLKVEESRRRELVGRLEKLAKKFNLTWKTEEIQNLRGEHLYLYSVSPPGADPSHLLLMTVGAPAPLPRETRSPGGEIRGRLAVIIDDIGFNERVSLELKNLGIPVTAAIIPNAPYAYDESRQIHQYGIEQIIHLPMQSSNLKMEADPANFILKGTDISTIRRLVHRARTLVPYARGVNNHMGSLATGDVPTMSNVLKVMREENLFFVDSRTSAATVAYRMAREMQIPTTHRDVFLEDINNGHVTYRFTRLQILKVAELSRQRGHAVAIGHPYPTTLKAIRDTAPEVQAMGVRFVPVSRLLEK